jgi:hypothetical protein
MITCKTKLTTAIQKTFSFSTGHSKMNSKFNADCISKELKNKKFQLKLNIPEEKEHRTSIQHNIIALKK